MKISLGFSPCPNDTFIFDALVNKKIDSSGLDLDVFLEDVQTLNQWALDKKLDASKISYGVLPLVVDDYNLLDSGGALGNGVGPLLVAKQPLNEGQVNEAKIAIPGENTTAHILFSLAFPKAARKEFMVFSEIEEAVLAGRADAGVLIHEGRFTFAQKGLTKIMDLGDFWEKQTNSPIPLGGIVVRNTLSSAIQRNLSRLIRQSVAYGLEHYPHLPAYVKDHAQEMDEAVMRQHINLYVNDFTLSLGDTGRNAISNFLHTYSKTHKVQIPTVTMVD